MSNNGETEAWVEYLKQKLECLGGKEKSKEPPATIHRVPHIIRRGNDDAYEPEIVSIGPYHRRNERVQAMETHKWQYLHSFSSRSGHLSLEEHFIPKALELKNRAQKCYSSDISFMEDKEFVEMLILDSCFILELFQKFHDRGKKVITETDPIFGHCTQWVVRCVARDLLLAENQLPFFVLQSFAKQGKLQPSVTDLAMNFFKSLYLAIDQTNSSLPPGEVAQKDFSCDDNESHLHHLLHLVHTHFVPPKPQNRAKSGSKKNHLIASNSLLPSFNKREETQFQAPLHPHAPLPTVPRAQRLQDSGITFKKGRGKNFLDIKFEEGVMEIPHLVVDHYTNTFLRNLIAFEQSYPCSGKCFTMYAAFMDFVVNTDKDVEILHQHGILDHGLGSEQDIALLFNEICKGLIVEPEDEDKYLLIVQDVIRYSNIPWNQWRAKLNRDYFGNPWAIISMTAAVVALSLTFVNSFFSIYRYYHPTP
ncbi:hypothetical protein H6P81_017188 [Aristolochia fimbriata]|uniref:Uncharacterized protein n=1 Tax=Aristolochia fimbriata TaxID=158543 RepID=A0AAV7DXS3_ARIFI|nr:hypothetical protein H6P81_017188 [Aristolochia fimbriata]